MTWTKLSDDFPERLFLLDISRSARYLQVEALAYCNRNLTDGLLPVKALRRVTDSADPEADAAALVEAGEWTLIEDGTAWQLDWSGQELAATVNARKRNNADRQKKYRERRDDRTVAHSRGDHRSCKPGYCPDAGQTPLTHNVTDHVTHNVTTPRPDPSRPDPTRPEGAGEGRGIGVANGSARATPTSSPNGQPSLPIPPHPYNPDPDSYTHECQTCQLPPGNRVHPEAPSNVT